VYADELRTRAKNVFRSLLQAMVLYPSENHLQAARGLCR
jgi:hypothetical protein